MYRRMSTPSMHRERSERDHSIESRSEPDRGSSLIEILISVVLLGTVVVATLGATTSSVIGTRVARDHAKAYQWLQSAGGVLQASERAGCDYDPVNEPADAAFADGEEKVRLTYQNRIRTGVVNPPEWEDRQITVLYPVKIWDGNNYWEPATAPQPCYDADGYLLQLVTLQVTSPDGRIIETIQVVKRD
jgi:Tfp pilus assembly protein PilV